MFRPAWPFRVIQKKIKILWQLNTTVSTYKNIEFSFLENIILLLTTQDFGFCITLRRLSLQKDVVMNTKY